MGKEIPGLPLTDPEVLGVGEGKKEGAQVKV
jgi:hypothetical protein